MSSCQLASLAVKEAVEDGHCLHCILLDVVTTSTTLGPKARADVIEQAVTFVIHALAMCDPPATADEMAQHYAEEIPRLVRLRRQRDLRERAQRDAPTIN